MQELIFIIILAVFIGGMFWSDRDSRRVRWHEFVELFARHMANEFDISYEMLVKVSTEREES